MRREFFHFITSLCSAAPRAVIFCLKKNASSAISRRRFTVRESHFWQTRPEVGHPHAEFLGSYLLRLGRQQLP